VTEGKKIPAFKLGNRWKFKKTILDQWMEQNEHDEHEAEPRKKPKSGQGGSAVSPGHRGKQTEIKN